MRKIALMFPIRVDPLTTHNARSTCVTSWTMNSAQFGNLSTQPTLMHSAANGRSEPRVTELGMSLRG
jgi:hypothetical protein